jgi:hypothetical protein
VSPYRWTRRRSAQGWSAYGEPVLPQTDVARIRRWVDARNQAVPERARGQVRFELDVADRHVTVYECRPPWRPEDSLEWSRLPIVRLRYTKAHRQWTTYGRDRNLRFHRFDLIAPSPRVDDLLEAIDADPTGTFSG